MSTVTYTDKFNCPPWWGELVEALDKLYNPGTCDISVTSLIDSPRIRQLKSQFDGQITMDLVDKWYLIRGTLAHQVVEHLPDRGPKRIKEVRLFTDVDGWTIAGQPDIVDRVWTKHWALRDYKCTYPRAIEDGLKAAWVAQVNIYRVMFEIEHDATVPEQFISTIYADWTKYQALKGSFPNTPCEDLAVPRWSRDEVMAYLEERVRLHKAAEHELPLCSDEERWKKPDYWAVQNKKTGRALRCKNQEGVPFSQAEANAFHASLSTKAFNGNEVVKRDGACIRCRDGHCSVAAFCTQWQAEQDKNTPVAGMTGVKGA